MTSLIDTEDLQACQRLLSHGSKSFAAAARLLPRRLRPAVTAMYAWCRLADDAVDQAGVDCDAAVAELERGLDRVMAGRPVDHPVERAFAAVVAEHAIPRALPEALIEGFAYDAQGRRYANLDELEGYCARVASAVGVMMTLLMGPRQDFVLARACDLGLAMQLTNIARDVGEDARAGRIYLPLDWMAEAGIEPEAFVRDPAFSAPLADLVRRLLSAAEGYYRLADQGIGHLPIDCRLAIRGARLIYADIATVIASRDYDTIHGRAYTSRARKLFLLARAFDSLAFRPQWCAHPARPAVRFLIEAVADHQTTSA